MTKRKKQASAAQNLTTTKYSIAIGQKRLFSSELIKHLELDRVPIEYHKACFTIEHIKSDKIIGIVFGFERRDVSFDMVVACEQSNGYQNVS